MEESRKNAKNQEMSNKQSYQQMKCAKRKSLHEKDFHKDQDLEGHLNRKSSQTQENYNYNKNTSSLHQNELQKDKHLEFKFDIQSFNAFIFDKQEIIQHAELFNSYRKTAAIDSKNKDFAEDLDFCCEIENDVIQRVLDSHRVYENYVSNQHGFHDNKHANLFVNKTQRIFYRNLHLLRCFLALNSYENFVERCESHSEIAAVKSTFCLLRYFLHNCSTITDISMDILINNNLYTHSFKLFNEPILVESSNKSCQKSSYYDFHPKVKRTLSKLRYQLPVWSFLDFLFNQREKFLSDYDSLLNKIGKDECSSLWYLKQLEISMKPNQDLTTHTIEYPSSKGLMQKSNQSYFSYKLKSSVSMQRQKNICACEDQIILKIFEDLRKILTFSVRLNSSGTNSSHSDLNTFIRDKTCGFLENIWPSNHQCYHQQMFLYHIYAIQISSFANLPFLRVFPKISQSGNFQVISAILEIVSKYQQHFHQVEREITKKHSELYKQLYNIDHGKEFSKFDEQNYIQIENRIINNNSVLKIGFIHQNVVLDTNSFTSEAIGSKTHDNKCNSSTPREKIANSTPNQPNHSQSLRYRSRSNTGNISEIVCDIQESSCTVEGPQLNYICGGFNPEALSCNTNDFKDIDAYIESIQSTNTYVTSEKLKTDVDDLKNQTTPFYTLGNEKNINNLLLRVERKNSLYYSNDGYSDSTLKSSQYSRTNAFKKTPLFHKHVLENHATFKKPLEINISNIKFLLNRTLEKISGYKIKDYSNKALKTHGENWLDLNLLYETQSVVEIKRSNVYLYSISTTFSEELLISDKVIQKINHRDSNRNKFVSEYPKPFINVKTLKKSSNQLIKSIRENFSATDIPNVIVYSNPINKVDSGYIDRDTFRIKDQISSNHTNTFLMKSESDLTDSKIRTELNHGDCLQKNKTHKINKFSVQEIIDEFESCLKAFKTDNRSNKDRNLENQSIVIQTTNSLSNNNRIGFNLDRCNQNHHSVLQTSQKKENIYENMYKSLFLHFTRHKKHLNYLNRRINKLFYNEYDNEKNLSQDFNYSFSHRKEQGLRKRDNPSLQKNDHLIHVFDINISLLEKSNLDAPQYFSLDIILNCQICGFNIQETYNSPKYLFHNPNILNRFEKNVVITDNQIFYALSTFCNFTIRFVSTTVKRLIQYFLNNDLQLLKKESPIDNCRINSGYFDKNTSVETRTRPKRFSRYSFFCSDSIFRNGMYRHIQKYGNHQKKKFYFKLRFGCEINPLKFSFDRVTSCFSENDVLNLELSEKRDSLTNNYTSKEYTDFFEASKLAIFMKSYVFKNFLNNVVWDLLKHKPEVFKISAGLTSKTLCYVIFTIEKSSRCVKHRNLLENQDYSESPNCFRHNNNNSRTTFTKYMNPNYSSILIDCSEILNILMKFFYQGDILNDSCEANDVCEILCVNSLKVVENLKYEHLLDQIHKMGIKDADSQKDLLYSFVFSLITKKINEAINDEIPPYLDKIRFHDFRGKFEKPNTDKSHYQLKKPYKTQFTNKNRFTEEIHLDLHTEGDFIKLADSSVREESCISKISDLSIKERPLIKITPIPSNYKSPKEAPPQNYTIDGNILSNASVSEVSEKTYCIDNNKLKPFSSSVNSFKNFVSASGSIKSYNSYKIRSFEADIAQNYHDFNKSYILEIESTTKDGTNSIGSEFSSTVLNEAHTNHVNSDTTKSSIGFESQKSIKSHFYNYKVWKKKLLKILNKVDIFTGDKKKDIPFILYPNKYRYFGFIIKEIHDCAIRKLSIPSELVYLIEKLNTVKRFKKSDFYYYGAEYIARDSYSLFSVLNNLDIRRNKSLFLLKAIRYYIISSLKGIHMSSILEQWDHNRNQISKKSMPFLHKMIPMTVYPKKLALLQLLVSKIKYIIESRSDDITYLDVYNFYKQAILPHEESETNTAIWNEFLQWFMKENVNTWRSVFFRLMK